MADLATLVKWALVVSVTQWVFREATHQRAKKKRGRLWFPPGVALRVVFGICTPMFGLASVWGFYEVTQGGAWWLAWTTVSVFLGMVFGRPGDITLDEDGICQRFWLGLYRKRIKWTDIDHAVVYGKERNVVVQGHDGRSIRHGQYHIGKDQFIAEISSHTVVQ